MLGDGDGIKVGDALKGASVTAKVVGHGRADKVRIVKFRRRKHHRKQMGNRQHYTESENNGIDGGDKKEGEEAKEHKKGGGSWSKGRDNNTKYLGGKSNGGKAIEAGKSKKAEEGSEGK